MSNFFDHPLSKPFRVNVFENFVREFETRINQLSLVQMGAKVSKEFDGLSRTFSFCGMARKLTAVVVRKTPLPIWPSWRRCCHESARASQRKRMSCCYRHWHTPNCYMAISKGQGRIWTRRGRCVRGGNVFHMLIIDVDS